MTPKNLDRRNFIKKSAIAAGIGTALTGLGNINCSKSGIAGEARTQFKVPPIETVRIGFVGVGGMGFHHVKTLMKIEGVEIKAVCDIVEDKVKRAQDYIVEAGHPKPDGYSRGEYDFKRMCERDDLDLVYTATPWKWHVPVCLEAMNTGKHAATEVPAAIYIDDCWQLVETAEKTNLHCVMMENCCYDRIELMTLNMVRKGLLGEILHAEAGYLHDLRALKFSDNGEGLWRIAHSIKRNANLYPTHGIGPVSQVMNINRGDQFDYLVSMSSNSRGLHLFAEKKYGPDSQQAKQNYALGDVNTCLIKTKNGKTIYLKHDCDTPRPYSRINLIQGTKGIARKWPDKIYIEDSSPAHEWEDYDRYVEQYEHPLWKAIAEKGKGSGHGGMDFIEDYRLIECLRTGSPMDMDVYDAAAWSAIVEVTEQSVARKSAPIAIPDFTRGKWKTNPPLGIIEG